MGHPGNAGSPPRSRLVCSGCHRPRVRFRYPPLIPATTPRLALLHWLHLSEVPHALVSLCRIPPRLLPPLTLSTWSADECRALTSFVSFDRPQ